MPGEDVAQLGAGVPWRVAHVHAADADERAVVQENCVPAAEASPLVAPQREAQKPLEYSTERWVSWRTLQGRCCAPPASLTRERRVALVGLGLTA